MSFPTTMTEEEEALQKKYAKLKKKVRHDRKFYFVGNPGQMCNNWSWQMLSSSAMCCVRPELITKLSSSMYFTLYRFLFRKRLFLH